MTTKTPKPEIKFIVTIGYQTYAFDTVEKAARLIDLISLGTRIEYDYEAPRREDGVRTYYRDNRDEIGTIDARRVVINDEKTPRQEEEKQAA